MTLNGGVGGGPRQEGRPPADTPSTSPRNDDSTTNVLSGAEKLRQLIALADRGWRLFPTAWLEDDGTCECGKSDCNRPGKHPIVKWKNPDPGHSGATSAHDIIENWHSWKPKANWAIVLDDIFVVDIDKKYGGMETLAELEENDPEFLGITLAQETPSGGRQYFYRQPPEQDITIVPQGKLQGLPGFEIKALRKDGDAGSYVLVPPSAGRHWLNDQAVSEASPFLLQRCRAYRSVGSTNNGSDHPKEAFDWDWAKTPGAVPMGLQNDTLMRGARSLHAQGANDSLALSNLHDIVKAFTNYDVSNPWTLDAADQMWERTKREVPAGRSIDATEQERRWADNLFRQSKQDHDEHVPNEEDTAQDTAPPESDDAPPEPSADMFIKDYKQEKSRRRARRRLDEEEMASARGPRTRRTAREFSTIPKPSVVMDDVLAAEVNLLGGPSAAGKSLIARDWSLHVATGAAWRGHSVTEPRAVLWVVSEGTHDFEERWCGQPLWEKAADQIFIVDEPINLVGRSDVDWLLDEYADVRPGLVIFDVIYGMGLPDDNGTKDVGPLIASLKRISAGFGGGTLAIGHNGHNGERRFRGWSGWRQLAAVEWHMADDSFTCEKSKIADKRRLSASYRVEYPDVVWQTPIEAVADVAGKVELIRRDVAQYPNATHSDRARRLMTALDMQLSTARKFISRVVSQTDGHAE